MVYCCLSDMIKEEFDRIESGDRWGSAYRRMKESALALYPYGKKVARKHNSLNRYPNVVPYDRNRIKLQDFEIDYINASKVKVPSAKREYIVSQGPLERTISHFWLMIWQQKCPGIIMLNKLVEEGKDKCAAYFPDPVTCPQEESVEYEDIGIGVRLTDRKDLGAYVIRDYAIFHHQTKKGRRLIHLQYVEWPDFGVPHPLKFIQFLHMARDLKMMDKPGSAGPVCIHCSAGIGRSGAFLVIDSLINLIKEQQNIDIDIKQLVVDVRGYRPGLIQTRGQLRFVYICAISAARDERILDMNADTDDNSYVDSKDGYSSELADEGDDDEETEKGKKKQGFLSCCYGGNNSNNIKCECSVRRQFTLDIEYEELTPRDTQLITNQGDGDGKLRITRLGKTDPNI